MVSEKREQLIFIWLMGGLGNVLFQVLVYNIIRSNSTADVMFVQSLTKKNIITKILSWSIHEKLYQNIIPENKLRNFGLIKTIIIIFFARVSKYLKRNIFKVNFFTNNGLKGRHLFGYYQDKSFLQLYAKEVLLLGGEIRRSFVLQKNEKTVVHFRKGDSEWANKFADYYHAVRDKLFEESDKVLIVTDSPKDAKDFFATLKNVEICESISDLHDFATLLSSEKLYCAPSTFSWWAAHSTSKETQVIAPLFFKEKLGVYINDDRLNYL